jgi:hypothetical protein
MTSHASASASAWAARSARRIGGLPMLLACALMPAVASAGTLPLHGVFVDDDETFSIGFTLSAADTVTATSLGFAGGARVNGSSVAAGGFATVLSLFDGGGELLQVSVGSANVCASAPGDPSTSFHWDACFSATLVAGAYTLVLSQDGNQPTGPTLADGFDETGQPDYTGWSYLGTGARFINADGSARDGHWALDLTAAAVPEPATWALLACGLALLVPACRRARR